MLPKRNNNNNSNNNYNKNFLLNLQRSFIEILFFYLLFGYCTAIFGLLLWGQPLLSSIFNQIINGYLGKRLDLKAQSFLKEKGMLLNSPWYIPKYFHATATSKIKFFFKENGMLSNSPWYILYFHSLVHFTKIFVFIKKLYLDLSNGTMSRTQLSAVWMKLDFPVVILSILK